MTAYAVSAGTVIQNTATIEYSSVSESGLQIESNAADFIVDRMLSVTVQPADAELVEVFPNMSDAVMRFNVLNLGNSTVDLQLFPLATVWEGQPLSADADLHNIRVYVDDGNGIFDPEFDTYSYIDDIAPRESRVVFVIVDVPETSQFDEVFGLSLNAKLAEPGPLDLTQTVTLQGPLILNDDSGNVANSQDTPNPSIDKNNNLTQMFDVFADPEGDLDSDIISSGIKDIRFNGQHAASNGFRLNAAPLFVTKTADIIDDDGGNVPYAGATIRYFLAAEAVANVSEVSISDAIPEGTTYIPNSLALNSQALTDAADGDNGNFTNNTIYVQLGSLEATQVQTISFEVTVQ